MKRKLLLSRSFVVSLCIIFALCTHTAIAQSLPVAEQDILKKRLLPQPKSITLSDGEVVLDNTLTLTIELAVDDTNAKSEAAEIFKRCFGTEPKIIVAKKKDVPKEKEAYRISASGKTLRLAAADFAGIRHAFSTIRQLAESNHNGEKLVAYWIPQLEISDAPAMAFRGLHLCWLPEMRLARIEQAIRMAAYYKFNYVVLEFWGVYPFAKHPEFGWEEYKAKPEDVKRLVKLGKELGITLIPQFNIFGHASAARSGTQKHALLDRHPEYQPLFEPDGWVWCLSNPATRSYLTDIVLEMYDMFDQPPYFHIGCDEANAPESRSSLRADYRALLKDHILYFQKLFAERNCRIMMWHDMLIPRSDPQWKGYVANGEHFTAGLLEQLPKDIVICDWQYGHPKENETWATMRYFKELGFTVLASPWENTDGIRSQGKTIVEAKLDGMLCTTWHHFNKGTMHAILSEGAQTTWNATSNYRGADIWVFGVHLRQIGWDMSLKDYRDYGHTDLQVPTESIQGVPYN
ncbi:MAG: beta-N-acetylhexosaminidase [Candidatus Symbiothrix sp.]|jgi:hypothetical protein|nr:beta-N-acetylhexosaminidase [Candidatus Symbiothrix sp.]